VNIQPQEDGGKYSGYHHGCQPASRRIQKKRRQIIESPAKQDQQDTRQQLHGKNERRSRHWKMPVPLRLAVV
jgi:hypothetical protein